MKRVQCLEETDDNTRPYKRATPGHNDFLVFFLLLRELAHSMDLPHDLTLLIAESLYACPGCQQPVPISELRITCRPCQLEYMNDRLLTLSVTHCDQESCGHGLYNCSECSYRLPHHRMYCARHTVVYCHCVFLNRELERRCVGRLCINDDCRLACIERVNRDRPSERQLVDIFTSNECPQCQTLMCHFCVDDYAGLCIGCWLRVCDSQ